jgi:hypothetical protein
MSEQRQAVPGCSDPERGSHLEAYLEHALAPEEEGRFEDHYFRCAACLDEIRLRQALPAALHEASSGRRRAQLWFASAGAAAAVLLVYTSYLGFVELPGVARQEGVLRDEVSELKTSLQGLNANRDPRRWTGPVSFVVLTGPARAAGARPARVRLHAGQPFIPLGAVPALPPAVMPGDRFTFQISAAGGEVAWALDMTAQEITQALEADRIVTFLIPAASLAEGEYRVALLPGGGRTAKPSWETVFRVETTN